MSHQTTVALGFGGASGFAPNDLTSPERAATAGAVPDLTMTEPPVTELRVHGVSGSDGPTMLEHPNVVQVAGDSTTMFYRRWTPAVATGGCAVPWRLEAYSWGGLTESPLASASWLLLAPLMLFNVAHFALPAEAERQRAAEDATYLSRGRGRFTAQALLRLLALSATVQFAVVLVAAFVNTLALQASQAGLPSWLQWYQRVQVANRVRLAVVAVIVVLGTLWWIGEKTRSKYEARTSRARPKINEKWALTQTAFWEGSALVRRQRDLHMAAALACIAFILCRPSRHMPGLHVAVAAGSLALLTAAAVTLFTPLAERYRVTLAQAEERRQGDRDSADHVGATIWWCRTLLLASAAALVGASFLGGWPDAGKEPATISGFTNFCALTLIGQALLVVLFGLYVAGLDRSTKNKRAKARRAIAKDAPQSETRNAPRRSPRFWAAAETTRPFLRGQLASLLALMAVCLGGMFSSAMVLFFARLLGTPVPNGAALVHPSAHTLEIPWPIYVMALAPVGLLAGGIVGVGWMVGVAIRDKRLFLSTDESDVNTMRVADYYHGRQGGDGDFGHGKASESIAKSWAHGRMVDQAAVVACCGTVGMVAAVAFALTGSRDSQGGLPGVFYGFGTAIGLFVAGLLVTLLRSAFNDPSRRKTIGALWDVGTFWPRAAHPFAPPCYAERAVPELVDRIRILTGTVAPSDTDPAWADIQAHTSGTFDAESSTAATVPATRLLLTGYSQGSVIAPAVIAQLPQETLDRVALLTLACPARRLYGRAFPGYFGPEAIETLDHLLSSNTPVEESASETPRDRAHREKRVRAVRWRNVVRKSDYIGSWVFSDPMPTFTLDYLAAHIDQPCPDPVVLAADADQTPPPIHAHSDFFQDPFIAPVSRYLVDDLCDTKWCAGTRHEQRAQTRSQISTSAHVCRRQCFLLLQVAMRAIGHWLHLAAPPTCSPGSARSRRSSG
jgi:hypothetical protein